MSHLIRSLQGKELDGLRDAYSILAETYLTHRAGRTLDPGHKFQLNYESLRDTVLKSEEEVPLAVPRQASEFITADAERPVELFNNLGQVEVLVAAIDILRAAGFEPDSCAPTQQSTNQDGEDIPDLSGPGWALEAFGGHDLGNNKKLMEDLCSLHRWYEQGHDVFLAFRDEAWKRYRRTPLQTGQAMSVSGTTRKTRSEFGEHKVKCQASLLPLDQIDSVWACRVERLRCTAR